MADDRVALTKQVKEANDIVAVVGSYIPLQPSGPIFKGLCPFHNDHRPSLDVDPRRQRFRCWACGKFGDVFTFVQEFEKVDFINARAILARRVGISLEGESSASSGRVLLLEVMRWAAQKYQECLIDSPLAEAARLYLSERKLNAATIRQFGLGFAPLQGDWLVHWSRQDHIAWESLVEVGLIAQRQQGNGFYDRFRDRVMFPIRDLRGQTVGFGGRILPTSPYASRSPKYYNSAETPLFSKSELLYGLDLARSAGTSEGYLAVVEGYTDVMMAHQMGIPQVVATMGTALNARHVRQLRRWVPRVVLVFDADAGGMTGIDRALEIFISEDVELAIATLPEGLDPCDLLLQQGPEAFRRILAQPMDALDFKLEQLFRREESRGVEGTRRVVDAILGVLALAPEQLGQLGQVKRELIITRLAARVGLRQETVWARYGELKTTRRPEETPRPTPSRSETTAAASAPAAGPAPPEERELLEVLLADPAFVPLAMGNLSLDDVTHPGLRRLLEHLFALYRDGDPPDLDGLRVRLVDSPALVQAAMRLQFVGKENPDKATWFRRILAAFQKRKAQLEALKVKDQLTGVSDHDAAVALLRKLQSQAR